MCRLAPRYDQKLYLCWLEWVLAEQCERHVVLPDLPVCLGHHPCRQLRWFIPDSFFSAVVYFGPNFWLFRVLHDFADRRRGIKVYWHKVIFWKKTACIFYLSLKHCIFSQLPSSSLRITAVDSAKPNSNISCFRSEEEEFPLITFTNLESKPTLYLVAVSEQNLPSAILSLDNTVTLCPDKVKPGAFHRENIVIFLMPDSPNNLSHNIQDTFSKSNYQKHVKVAVFRRLASKRTDALLYWRYNFFAEEIYSKVLFTEDFSVSVSDAIFRRFDMRVSGITVMPCNEQKSSSYLCKIGIHHESWISTISSMVCCKYEPIIN